MKKLAAITLLASVLSANSFNIEAGGWYINWDQTSTSSDFINNKDDALEVNYDIDDSIAAVIRGDLEYNGIAGNFEYYTTKLNSDDKKEMSGYNIGVSILNKIPHIDLEARAIKSDFKGSIVAVDKSDDTTLSSGIFKTKVTILDFLVYPFNKYIGIGYRKYKYEFPQDVYLIRNSDGEIVTDSNGNQVKGLINVEYEGNFWTLSINNRRFTSLEDEYKGVVFDLIVGKGTLDPNATGFNQWIETSDATLIDLYGGYSLKSKKYGIVLGFRYNKIDTKANKTDGDYSLMTEFNTEFYGPFINLNYRF